ncbi:MAG: ATP-binding protein [Planctomycetes bacterium]|nr:ATP-binding protein [Planctomycetota bacterium]
MTDIDKGKTPFYPQQPVPVELFVGRASEIQRIVDRGVKQVALGKPVSIFIEGEYGIGKTSIAGYVQSLAERDHGLHGVYASLGGCDNLTDMAAAVLEGTIRSGVFAPKRAEKIKNWLARYIGRQKPFGFNLNFDALQEDAPSVAQPQSMLGFLGEIKNQLEDTGVSGITLVLDEINGITSDPKFAHFIKGLVEANAMGKEPVPLLLILCGVEERRSEMIQRHQPVERIFDIITIGVLSDQEMREFFESAFQSANMKIDPKAMELLTHYSAGFPKIMHLLGDEAYWADTDGRVDADDATVAIVRAAEEVGKKYVDQQVFRALRSDDYHSILNKIGALGSSVMSFTKQEVSKDLNPQEKSKFNNFLRRMKGLHVLRSGETRGQYLFNSRMVRLYIWLKSQEGELKKN